MSNLTFYARWDELPDCCKECRFRDCYSRDEYSTTYNFCTRGVGIPVRKKTCKIQQEYPSGKDGE